MTLFYWQTFLSMVQGVCFIAGFAMAFVAMTSKSHVRDWSICIALLMAGLFLHKLM